MNDLEGGYPPGSAGWIELTIKVPVSEAGFAEMRRLLTDFLECVTPKEQK